MRRLEKVIFNWLNEEFKPSSLHTHDDYPHSIFYVKDNIIIGEENWSEKTLWVHFDKIWISICQFFSLHQDQVGPIIKKWITHIEKNRSYLRNYTLNPYIPVSGIIKFDPVQTENIWLKPIVNPEELKPYSVRSFIPLKAISNFEPEYVEGVDMWLKNSIPLDSLTELTPLSDPFIDVVFDNVSNRLNPVTKMSRLEKVIFRWLTDEFNSSSQYRSSYYPNTIVYQDQSSNIISRKDGNIKVFVVYEPFVKSIQDLFTISHNETLWIIGSWVRLNPRPITYSSSGNDEDLSGYVVRLNNKSFDVGDLSPITR